MHEIALNLDEYPKAQYNVHMKALHFVWDTQKATTNYSKHGISFEEAQSVFDDEYARLRYDPDHSQDEDRFLLLGMSNSLHILVVCHCHWEDETSIRIISARKATRRESRQYEAFQR